MRNLSSASHALSVCAAVSVLAACSSSDSRLAVDDPTQQTTLPFRGSDMAAQLDYRKSWMDPSARKGALLYVSVIGTDVYVFSYPKGALVGTLTGLTNPDGECVDKVGDVWITLEGTSQIVEFAHGGTAPIATLNDPGQSPVDCSVNMRNGDLAVANIATISQGGGSLSIYKKARGNPTTVPAFAQTFALGYANIGLMSSPQKGNVFLDGLSASGGFSYGILPKGQSGIGGLDLKVGISYPGGIQWDGKYVAVGDAKGAVIYQTSLTDIIGSTPLIGAFEVFHFFIKGKTVVAADVGRQLGAVEFYNYPAGGSALKTITGLGRPIGVAISQ
jgi:hypothetical protein